MQWSSSLSLSVANYTAIEPVILVIASIITFYFLRRLMEAYNNSEEVNLVVGDGLDEVIGYDPDAEEDNEGTPILTAVLLIFAIVEATLGLIFAILINFVLQMDTEFFKRVVCILSLFISAVVNELGMAICKGGRQALLSKTFGYFINLVSCQFTWWLSYYKGSQLTLYGLGAGFLSLLFGVLYTLEMSLKVAQLNSNPGPINGSYAVNEGDTYSGEKVKKKITTFGPSPPSIRQQQQQEQQLQLDEIVPEIISHGGEVSDEDDDDETDESVSKAMKCGWSWIE
jgi:hypothetical protein